MLKLPAVNIVTAADVKKTVSAQLNVDPLLYDARCGMQTLGCV